MKKIKKGYKYTELGIIPEDWKVVKLDDILSITTGGKNTQDRDEKGKYPFFVRSSKIEKINSYSFDGEGILTAGDGVGTGKVFHYYNGKFDFHQRVYLLYNFKDGIDGKYVFKYFCKNFYSRISQLTAKSSVDSVRKEMISEMQITLPPEAEQTAIATVLSDVDSLIEALDKKISKKQLIKQGAMQELLTGKKRLAGFSEPWVEKNLGEVSSIKTGNRNGDEQCDSGKHPFFVRSNNIQRINSYAFNGEAILIPGEGGIGKIFHYIDGKFDYHQRVYKISNFPKEVNGKFIYYYLTRNFGDYALQQTAKATVDSLRLPTFLEYSICIPISKKEQTAIANILSDMDNEIEELKNRHDKYISLKKGAMQKLLAGQIRLSKVENNYQECNK